MRLAVTGKTGQVVSALIERSSAKGVTVFPVGRPEFDLSAADAGLSAIADIRPDAIISAAAYTFVDKAETDVEAAEAVNAVGPGKIADLASRLNIPIVHLSTDYVFDGKKKSPYVETDPTNPLGIYGATKLLGEIAVAAATSNHAILRTAWVYSPFGSNFLKTMLRVAAERPELRVVNDQTGNPTSALDIADAAIAVAHNLIQRPDEANLRGVFHMSGTGEANWAEFASEIFDISRSLGGPSAQVVPILTSQYPTPARRPQNSRLENGRLQRVHGVYMPEWRASTRDVVTRVLRPQA